MPRLTIVPSRFVFYSQYKQCQRNAVSGYYTIVPEQCNAKQADT